MSQKGEFVKLWDDKIFGKNIIKSVHSQKVNSLLQFVVEIWALSRPIISIQNLLILHWEGQKQDWKVLYADDWT